MTRRYGLRHYILDEADNPVELPMPEGVPLLDALAAVIKPHAQWIADNEARMRVAEDFIDDVRVSTVFLSVGISFGEPPDMFETMLFKPGQEAFLFGRCATWNEAKGLHDFAVAMVKNGELPWQS
jgi:hypothetical protein